MISLLDDKVTTLDFRILEPDFGKRFGCGIRHRIERS